MASILFISPPTRTEARGFVPTRFGAGVYDRRPVTIPISNPDDVYLIYISVKNGANFRRQYRTKRGSSTSETIAKQLYALAKQGKTKYEVGKDFLDIEWQGQCHLYVALEIAGCYFANDPTKPKYDPILFHESKDIYGTNATFYYDKNMAFYDGYILNNNVLGVPAFRCTNYFTDEHDQPLKHPRSRIYGFEIRYMSASGLEIVDPDGQNQGPPS